MHTLDRFPKVSASDLGTETDTNQNQQLCYHVLGQPQSTDVVVLADPEHPLWMFGAEVTDDGRWGWGGGEGSVGWGEVGWRERVWGGFDM